MSQKTNKNIGRYEILDEIGSGGFATVFRALDPTLEREVAVKVMRPALMGDRSFVARFEQEAKTIARLEHANIIPIYDCGEFEGRLFLVMKLMSVSLAGLIRGKGLPWKQVVDYARQVGAGLDFAHTNGLVHRDIKPENILINYRTGTAALGDFGIVKALESSTVTMSLTGGIIGTPAYTPPEVWNGEKITHATDTYALACVVFEMIVGHKLFDGKTPSATMASHFRPPVFPAQWPDEIPPELADVLTVALAKDPEERYGSTSAFVKAISDLDLDPFSDDYEKLKTVLSGEKWEEAISVGEKIVLRNPNYRDVTELVAKAREKSSSNKAALVGMWRDLVERALTEGEWQAALVAIQRWQAISPKDPDIQRFFEKAELGLAESQKSKQLSEWRRRGEEAILSEDWIAAERASNQWRQISPGDPVLQTFDEKIKAGKEKAEKARQWRDLANSALSAREWEAALVAAHRLREMAPDDPSVHKVLEKAQAGIAESDTAEQIKQWKQRGQEALRANDWEGAYRAAWKWRQLAPNDPDFDSYLRKIKDEKSRVKGKTQKQKTPVEKSGFVRTGEKPPINQTRPSANSSVPAETPEREFGCIGFVILVIMVLVLSYIIGTILVG